MTHPIFGFGHGFSGTKLLTKIISTDKRFDCRHERRSKESPQALFDSYVKVYKGLANPNVIIKSERLGMVNRTTASGKIFGEVNCMLSYYVPSLNRFWPNSRFIFISRNPKTLIRSIFNSGGYEYSLFPGVDLFWWPTPHEKDSCYDEWDQMDPLEKSAWAVNMYFEVAFENIKDIPDERVLIFPFEDMISGKNLSKLYGFAGMRVPDPALIKRIVAVKIGKTPNRVKNSLPEWKKMDEVSREKIMFFAGWSIKRLGF